MHPMMLFIYIIGAGLTLIQSDQEKVGCVNSDLATYLLRMHVPFDGEGWHARTRGKIELTLECMINESNVGTTGNK